MIYNEEWWDFVRETDRLIHIFMGRDPDEIDDRRGMPEYYDYHTSWDDIMEVLQKIESITELTPVVQGDICYIYTDGSEENKIVGDAGGKGMDWKDAAYMAIAQFVRQYKK